MSRWGVDNYVDVASDDESVVAPIVKFDGSIKGVG
jgi:hypothetical protein